MRKWKWAKGGKWEGLRNRMVTRPQICCGHEIRAMFHFTQCLTLPRSPLTSPGNRKDSMRFVHCWDYLYMGRTSSVCWWLALYGKRSNMCPPLELQTVWLGQFRGGKSSVPQVQTVLQSKGRFKPPLGVRPGYTKERARLTELCACMSARLGAGEREEAERAR